MSLLDEALGPDDRLFVGSSMPIRDVEWFYHPPGPGPEVLTNRGANGIDGTVSTALGASLDCKRTVLLCGDLTFLHDSNALLSAYGHRGDLTVVVINNQGGGIFNHLAVAQSARFEQLWGTPQATDLGKLCAAHKVRHDLADGWSDLRRSPRSPRQGRPRHRIPHRPRSRRRLAEEVVPLKAMSLVRLCLLLATATLVAADKAS